MKPFTFALAMSLALANSAQAEESMPEIEVVSTENQRWLLAKQVLRKSAARFSMKLPALSTREIQYETI